MLSEERIEELAWVARSAGPDVVELVRESIRTAARESAEIGMRGLAHEGMPELPCGIVQHPKLGELYDRLQVHQYAVKHCEKLCAMLLQD